jgi:enoyl-CoA hydratase/carnithine racemase
MLHGTENGFTSGNEKADVLKSGQLVEGHPTVTFLFCLLDLKKPVVAAVTGAAVGMGTTLLLHCDLVYADNSAKFQMPFVSLALVPEAASSLLLPLIVGQQKAAELILLGEAFNAMTAAELNIINKVVDDDQLLRFSLAQAQMKLALVQFSKRLQSDEAKQRFKALLQK